MTRRIYFIANAVWGDLVGGGDIHFFELAKGAAEAGYEVFLVGGPALQKHALNAKIPATVLLSEPQRRLKINEGSLRGQLQMFCDYVERCVRSLKLLRQIHPEDIVYSVTDYWCDSLPALLSPARRKSMVFHMESPTLGEIWRKSRPDVEAGRLASIHYWFSQNLSLRLFRRCRSKHIFYLHPDMKPRLLKLGYNENEISQISYGVDSRMAEAEAKPPVKYDVCWIGRVHRQKGIDDLLITFQRLSKTLPGFRALLMGKVEPLLRPRIEEMGLRDFVDFSGFVSEEDKLRLFKASRLFLMPSRHEGSPRVVGEALICGVPVLAYDLSNYRPIFGDFACYVPAFDLDAFVAEAERMIRSSREGHGHLDRRDLAPFRSLHSWETTRAVFLKGIPDPQMHAH